MDKIPWLSILTFLPALGAASLIALRSERIIKSVALGASLATLGVACGLAWAFDPAAGAAMQFPESISWISAAGLKIRYALGMDGIALAMALLTALLTPLCILASWNGVQDRVRGFYLSLLLLETGMMGVFLARDLFLFYVFWEAMLVPMLLIIGVWGGPRRVYASIKFLLYTLAGSLLMLVAVLAVYFKADGTFDIGELTEFLPSKLSPETQGLLFLAFSVAFAIKVPLFPFHTWLPDAHVEAPTAGSVILAGVLLKMGAYGFLRFSIPFFPDAAVRYAPLMIALAVVSVVFGALMCMAQSDVKKLIAYSSVSHLGFVVLGIFSFTAAGGQGAVLQMVNHGLSTGALFLLVGVIYERTHRRGTDDFGGLAKVMPRYATIFMIVTLSSIGLPGLNGFVGEFLVLKGAFEAHRLAAAVAALGVVLGAVYMLRLYRDVFWGPVTAPRNEKLADVSRLEVGSLAPLLALIFVLGVAPNLLLTRTEAAVQAAFRRVSRNAESAERIPHERR
jgi:NADH-quinone oxidoreductase subunit M